MIVFYISYLKVGLDKLSMFLRKKSFGTRINQRLYCSETTKR